MVQSAFSADIVLKRIVLQENVEPTDNVNLIVTIDNDGDEVKDSSLKVYIPDLGVRKSKIISKLKSQEAANLNFVIPEDANPGYYVMKVVYYNDGFRKVKHREILIN